MDLDQIRDILSLVREHQLSEFEIEHNGLRLKLRREVGVSPVVSATSAPAAAGGAQGSSPSAAPASAGGLAETEEAGEAEIELAIVKSPIVGTFYRSLEPGAPSLVEIGSIVKKGQVLCIIEAMKLMNEIDSEYDGEIVNIYVENGQPVQYGERLFAMRTT